MKTPPDSHDHSGCDHDRDHDHAKCGHDHGPKREHTHTHTHEHGGGCCGHDHGEQQHHHHHGKEGEAGHEHSPSHSHGPAEVAAEEKEWTRRFFLFLEFTVLMVWAVVMIWFYASGRVEKYLVGEGLFRIQVLAAGLALFVMGLFNWLMRAQNAGCGHDHSADGDDCCGHDHDHGHAHHEHGPECGHSHEAPAEEPHTHHHHEGSVSGRGVSLVLLTLSVSAAAAMTADDFSDSYKKSMVHADAGRPAEQGPAPEQYKIAPDSATAAAAPGGQKAGVTLELIEKYQKRNAAGNFELDVMQLYYSGSDPEYAAVMKGQGVETVGQVVKDPSSPDTNRYRVFVLQVSCCAADARPFSLPVELSGPHGEIQEMGWYKLAGKIDYIEERGVTTAILRASDVQATVRPKDPRALF